MENNFRVCVMFKTENKLNDKRFFIYIDKDNFKTIKHVEQHIISLFKLDKIKISVNDVFLPRNETVNIINPKDVLIVTQTIKKSNEVRNEEVDENDMETDVVDSRKTNQSQILDILSQELLEKCKSLKPSASTDGDCFSDVPKRKRKRTRKKKTDIPVDVSPVVMDEVYLPPMGNGKHVRFDDKKDDEIPETPRPETPIKQTDDDWKQNLLNLAKSKKVFSRTHEEITHTQPEKPETNGIKFKNGHTQHNENITIENIDIDKCPVINKYETNNTILFKKLVLDQNYCPNLSEYVLAKIIKVEDTEDCITLKILDNAEALHPPQGKFSLDDEEVVNPNIHAAISELIDVRLVNN